MIVIPGKAVHPFATVIGMTLPSPVRFGSLDALSVGATRTPLQKPCARATSML